MKKAHMVVLFLLFAASQAGARQAPGPPPGTGTKGAAHGVLLIVAHPDDEYEMAGTVYRITKELSGTVDQVIITDGEGGFRYSFLAGRYYGYDLTNEPIGRKKLPGIREREARRAGHILGIRHQWFLHEPDEHFTLDAEEVLQKSWRTNRVLCWLVQRLRYGHYDEVFVILPREDTHGEHKAASILALEAIEQLPSVQRPTVLGAEAGAKDPVPYRGLPGYPNTVANSVTPEFQFDRDVQFGFRNSLSYQIVVNWVISEHKSQGLFQTMYGQDRFESFWLFALNGNSKAKRAAAFFDEILPRSLGTGPGVEVWRTK